MILVVFEDSYWQTAIKSTEQKVEIQYRAITTSSKTQFGELNTNNLLSQNTFPFWKA